MKLKLRYLKDLLFIFTGLLTILLFIFMMCGYFQCYFIPLGYLSIAYNIYYIHFD